MNLLQFCDFGCIHGCTLMAGTIFGELYVLPVYKIVAGTVICDDVLVIV